MTRDDGSELLAEIASHRSAEFSAGQRVAVSLLERPVLLRPLTT